MSKLTDFFINDPTLCYLGLSDEQLSYMYEHKEYNPDPMSYYLGCWEGKKLLAVIKSEKFTENAVNSHIYMSSKLHHKKMTTKIKDLYVQYLIDNTEMTKVLVMTPETCSHVIEPLNHWGFALEGVFTNAIVWRQKLVDLHIYATDLIRGK